MAELMEKASSWLSLLPRITTINLLEVAIISILVYEILFWVKNTRAWTVLKGLGVILIFAVFAAVLHLNTILWILEKTTGIAVTALLVVFQPELRRALEQVGRTSLFGMQLFKGKADPGDLRAKWQSAIVAVCDSAEQLADSRTGALVVLERRTNLSEIIKTGTVLNADITPEMLGTIFYEGTPLHDGAVVVRDGRIEAAGCFLPLSNNLEIGKDMGTRHRAALGMSENSDAVVVVVSEETGIISLAKNGVLIRRLDRQNLFNLLEGDMVPPAVEEKKRPFWRRKHEKQHE